MQVQAKKAKKEAERAAATNPQGDTEMAEPAAAPGGDENPPGDLENLEFTDAELEAVEVSPSQ